MKTIYRLSAVAAILYLASFIFGGAISPIFYWIFSASGFVVVCAAVTLVVIQSNATRVEVGAIRDVVGTTKQKKIAPRTPDWDRIMLDEHPALLPGQSACYGYVICKVCRVEKYLDMRVESIAYAEAKKITPEGVLYWNLVDEGWQRFAEHAEQSVSQRPWVCPTCLDMLRETVRDA